MRWGTLAAPFGPVSVAVDRDAVRAVRFGTVTGAEAPSTDDRDPAAVLLADALDQLAAYLRGERTGFDLPVRVTGGTAFDRAVWDVLTTTPFGQTRTYGEVAAAVGDPAAARAVGVACHRNPLPLVVPCHRVVGAGGKLVGFGGGLATKRWLLEHEARVSMESAWS